MWDEVLQSLGVRIGDVMDAAKSNEVKMCETDRFSLVNSVLRFL